MDCTPTRPAPLPPFNRHHEKEAVGLPEMTGHAAARGSFQPAMRRTDSPRGRDAAAGMFLKTRDEPPAPLAVPPPVLRLSLILLRPRRQMLREPRLLRSAAGKQLLSQRWGKACLLSIRKEEKNNNIKNHPMTDSLRAGGGGGGGVTHASHGSERAKKMKGCAGDTGEESRKQPTGHFVSFAFVPIRSAPVPR